MDVFRLQVRAVLRARGLEFCDDETDDQGQALPHRHASAAAEAMRHEQLIAAGVTASSTDDERQTVGALFADIGLLLSKKLLTRCRRSNSCTLADALAVASCE